MARQLMIAGTHSGVGKTTIVVGLIAALRRRGLVVQPFKVGPDYIDPTHHSRAAGRACRNLDSWLLPPPRVRALYARAAADADVALIEGVMGLYDGRDYDSEAGSTGEVAKLLDAPVIVVIDAGRMARSAGAVALGYQRFDPELHVVGYIVNRAASASHGAGSARAIADATGLPVLGWLPRDERLQVPERHLGLVPAVDAEDVEIPAAAGDAIEAAIDLDRLLNMARALHLLEGEALPALPCPAGTRPIIAVARDEAFHFTYAENIELLHAAGATIAFFSPLRDAGLPAGTAGVILSGGFPEMHAQALAGNVRMHSALRDADARRLPIYAECGGMMYLTKAIVDAAGRRHPMVGLLPGTSFMTPRVCLGYRQARAARDSWLLHEGEEVRGHEFHYSVWRDRPRDLPPAYLLHAPDGTLQPEGVQRGHLWASYVHLHFWAKPELAARFVCAASAGGG